MIPINFYNLVRIIYFKFIENYRLKFTWIHNHMIIFKSSYCYHISLSDSSILIRFCIVLAKLERVLSSAKLWAEVEKVIAKDFKWNRTYKWSRRNFSLVAHYSLKFTRYLLLVVKVVTRCKITRCRSCSLQKITRYSLQNLLVTSCKSCSLQKFTRYSLQNSLVTRCRRCSLQKFTRYSLQNSFVAKNYSLLVAKFACYSQQQITCYSVQKIIHHTLKQSQVLKERWKI